MGTTFFTIGKISVYTYGFFIVIGVIVSGIVLYYLAKKQNLPRDRLLEMIAYPLLAGIVGARLLYYFLYPQQFSSFKQILYLWDGGLVSWGGFIFALLALYLIVGKNRHFLQWLDNFVVASLLGLSVGRLGSFLSGEYAGIPYDGFLSFNGVHAVTLYQSAWNLLVFFVLILIILKKNSYFDRGVLTLEALTLYSLGRFTIDLFRAEQDIIWGITLGQMTSLFVFLITLIIFMKIHILNKQ